MSLKTRSWIIFNSLVFIGLTVSIASAQGFPEPSPEHKILMKDAGEWKCDIKMWEPGSDESISSKGTESTKMIGKMWVIADFKSEFFGAEFTGQATSGYDPIKKKFVGTWVDSMTPHMMLTEGSYDKETDTMTWHSTGTDPATGKVQKGKNVVVYKGEDSRVMTMYMQVPGGDELFKALEITYTRKK